MSKEHSDMKTIIRALKVFNGFDGPGNDELWWRTDDDYAPVTLIVNCNDLFFWGTADCETLGPSSIDELEKAITDAKEAGEIEHGHLLWIARRRGMRPQKPYYKYFKEPLAKLFNECGPERDV